MKKLIMNVVSIIDGFETSGQIGGKANEKVLDIYLKNAFVSMGSARMNVSDNTDLALITNRDISDIWKKRFSEIGVHVLTVAFDSFVFPANFPWMLAFYKLTALKYVADELIEYDRILYLDCDTVIQSDLEPLWQELEAWENAVMMYSVNHTYVHPNRRDIIETNNIISGKNEPIVHFGGELLCAKRECLKRFMDDVERVYFAIKQKEFKVPNSIGDEALISIAAEKYNVIYANPYLFRFWTDKNFYLVSNLTVYDPVAIWHLPQEKRKGFIRVYKYMIKHNNCLPKKSKLLKYLSLPNGRKALKLYDLWWIFLVKMGKR